MSDITIIGLIIVAAVVLFVWNRIPVVVVAMGVGLSLWATGILTLPQALAGFGDPAVVFIAALFVVSAALDRTGVTAWAGQLLIAAAGEDSRTRLLVLNALLVALLTALISLNGAVAALLPVVVVMAMRLGRNPSQLLMPLVFSAHAGSLLALTGSPVNVLVAEAAANAGRPAFGFFSFTVVGVPLLLGSIAIIVLFGRKLLPERGGDSITSDFSRHARTLVTQYGIDRQVFRLRVAEGSRLAGMPLSGVDVARHGDLRLIAVQEGDGTLIRRSPIAVGDWLLVSGSAEAAASLAAAERLEKQAADAAADFKAAVFNRTAGLAEVVIPPRSPLIGQTVYPGMATESGDLVIIAVQRRGENLPGPSVEISTGDTLLLQGSWAALDVRLRDPAVRVVDAPEMVRSQAVPLSGGARPAIIVLVCMVVLLATGLVPPAVAGVGSAFALVLTRVLTVDQCYRAIDWTTVILVAAMMPLSVAMEQTGAARMLADGLVAMVGERSPYALLAGLFMLSAVLGQLISNTATALIVIPIGVAAATGMGVSPLPVLMSIAVVSAGALLTPIATPTNLMVMKPGGYAFGDYWKLGLPLMAWYFVIAVFLVPMVWRF